MPGLERLNGGLMPQSSLWDVMVIDVEISSPGLFEIL